LEAARESYHSEIVRLLLEHGAIEKKK